MFADARVFRRHFLDRAILYAIKDGFYILSDLILSSSKMATQVPPSTNPTPFANRPAPPTKDLEIPEDYKKTFRVST